MGLVNLFSKSVAAPPPRLPSGSFTVERQGTIIASTLPQSFPAAQTQEIAQLVLATFQEARAAGLPLQELNAHYAGFLLAAHELNGGAMIFLFPKPPGP